MTVRYSPSYAGVGELMKSEEMQAVVREAAERAKAYAESIAPAGDLAHDPHPGEYKASFEVVVTDHGGKDGDRAEAQLINTSDHAVNVEWQDNYHVLARTADALGGL